MLELNWLGIYWFISVIITLSFGVPTALFPYGAPRVIETLFRFGKTSELMTTRTSSLLSEIIERTHVPKRWFTHFYICASLYFTFLTAMVFSGYYYLSVPTWFITYLDCVAGSKRKAIQEPVAVIIAQTLIWCQACRRAYECVCVSVYSPGKIAVLHYFAGISFYYALGTSLVAFAPGFTKEGFHRNEFENMSWEWYQLFGAVLYFWAAAHQFRCSIILANLRKDKSGKVVSSQHKIPEGDWFCYVSCPHFLAEILVYIAVNIVLKFSNYLVILALTFTVLNQAFSAILNHQWYLDKFKDAYPKNRKAIFPFIF